jgi:hypothetical protein
MNVPHFWAEVRAHQPRTQQRSQMTVRRFGWSDHSQAEADKMANERPNPGVWPVAEDRRPRRDSWVRKYEEVARKYAACELIGDDGKGLIHPRSGEVCALHDSRSRALSGLEIA